MSEGGNGAGEGAGGVGGDSGPVVMRRLLDEPAGDPLTSHGWAIGLLRRTPAHRAPVGRKQRVRLALGQGTRRRALRFLRPAIAGLVLVGCGAAASAALGRWPEIVQAYHRLLAPTAASSATAEARARRWGAGSASRRASPATAAETAPVEAPVAEASPLAATPTLTPTATGALAQEAAAVPAQSLSSANRASVRGSGAPSRASWRPRRASARASALAANVASKPKTRSATEAAPAPGPAPAAPSEGDDTTPVLEAMRALRVEANPVRARRLLAGYLDRHPGGSLAEEALAMSIEAAVAHGDDDAPALARKYVRRYPTGHFSGLARRTLAGAAGAAN